MTDEEKEEQEEVLWMEPEEPQLDPDDPGEVPTSFATKGLGWSGREEE